MTSQAWDTMEHQAIGQGKLSASIRREAGSETTARFLRSLPMFSTTEPLPSYFRQLLEQLDVQEQAMAQARADEAGVPRRAGSR